MGLISFAKIQTILWDTLGFARFAITIFVKSASTLVTSNIWRDRANFSSKSCKDFNLSVNAELKAVITNLRGTNVEFSNAKSVELQGKILRAMYVGILAKI